MPRKRFLNSILHMSSEHSELRNCRMARSERSPSAVPVKQLLGFALLAEGYAAEAIPQLDFAHEFGALGIAQLQNGQASEAVASLQTALARSPDDPDLLYYLNRASSALSSQSLDKLL